MLGWDDLDYKYMLNLRRIQWEYYKKGMFPEMHHIYRRYFPDVTPLPHTWGKGEGGGGYYYNWEEWQDPYYK